MLEMLEDADSQNVLGETYVKCGKCCTRAKQSLIYENMLKYLYTKYNEMTVIDLWNFKYSKASDVV